MNIPKGLQYLLTPVEAFAPIARAEYPAFYGTSIRHTPSFAILYRQRGYPLGKSRKGFSKWLKQNYKGWRLKRR